MTPPNRGDDNTAAMAGAVAGVTVSLDVIYRLVLEIGGDVRDIKNTVQKLSTGQDDHENRIRALEKRVWTAAGTASAVAGSLGATLTFLATRLT